MSIKQKSCDTTVILRDILKITREDKGISQEELANAVCLKRWHIREIEEAETFKSFYSLEIKLQSAVRVGTYLGLSKDQFLRSGGES